MRGAADGDHDQCRRQARDDGLEDKDQREGANAGSSPGSNRNKFVHRQVADRDVVAVAAGHHLHARLTAAPRGATGDEATAAAEAMTLARRSVRAKGNVLVVAGDCHPQLLEVLQTRATPLGLVVKAADSAEQWDRAIAADPQHAAGNGRQVRGGARP